MSESDRSIVTVIDQLLQVIPQKETGLVKSLTEYKATLWNQAPEALKSSYNWEPVQRILVIYITSVDEPWQRTVVDIFSNKTG